MRDYRLELAVGLFVILGLLCVAYMTVKLGRLETFGGDYYSLEARFINVSGLTPNASVEVAGVRVGRVEDIRLSDDRSAVIVRFKVDKDLAVYDDAIASVKTSGLIGDKYIQLSPGGSGSVLAEGALITDTESSVDIGELIGKYAFGDVKDAKKGQ